MPYKPEKYRPPGYVKPSQRRPTSKERGFTYKWNVESRKWLSSPGAIHRLCEDCLAVGRTTIATEVHHLIRHHANPEVLWNTDLWVALCHPCHSLRTARGE